MKISCTLLVYSLCVLIVSGSQSSHIRPSSVNVGALLSLNSTIGRVAKPAIEAAVEAVNSNQYILSGTRLNMMMMDTKCDKVVGMNEGLNLMQNEVVAMLGPQSSDIARLVSQAAEEVQVPVISFAATDPYLNSSQFPYFIQATHTDYSQMIAIADLVEYFEWRTVTIIYTDNEYGRSGMKALEDVLLLQSGKDSDIIFYRAPLIPNASTSEIDVFLFKLNSMESRVFIVHLYSADTGFEFFSAAKRLSMMENGYAWITTDWLSTALDSSEPVEFSTSRFPDPSIHDSRPTATRSYGSALIPKHKSTTSRLLPPPRHRNCHDHRLFSPHLQIAMAAASSSPIQSSPSTSTSPSTSSSPSSSPPPPHSPSLSPTNPNSLSTTPDPNPNMAPTVALPPPAAIALPQHPPPPPESQPSSNPPPSAPTSTRRVPPPCWSVEETVALIDGYQDKWYTLRRGNLKANHWQDVADFVTSRCANLPGSSHKTAVQCRHKVEKLRKRYRSERQRCLRNQNRTSNSRTNSSSTWFFFKKMDAMELGPISNAPNRYHTSNNGNILSGASVGGNGNRDISCGYGNAIPTSVPSRHVPPQSTSPMV